MRRPVKAAAAAALIGVVAVIGAFVWLQRYMATPLTLSAAGDAFVVERGDTLRRVTGRLAEQGVLRAPAALIAFGRLSGRAERIQAGEYALMPGDSPKTLLDMLVQGRVKLHSLTIVEGWTVAELLAALAAHPAIRQTLEPGTPEELAATLELDYPHPEGLFFPETYRFARGTTDVELLRQAHNLLRKRLNAAWAGREPQAVIASPYEGLILASIVERESALERERAEIAGVFIRRLERGMRLQTDPTVIYGLGDAFDGDLKRRDLATDTPYNTYLRRGLPPTPIALPGQSALQAMAHPAPGDSLYFVATGRGDGSHFFTATLEAHNAAVARYLATLRQREN